MEDTKIKRRSFLKMTGAVLAGMALPFKSSQADAAVSAQTVSGGKFWINKGTANEYFRHRVVNAKNVQSANTIWAKVDGWWQNYTLNGYNEDFITWWVNDSMVWYEYIFDKGEMPPNGGHHTPGIATYGNRKGRGDSNFSLNSAFKSITLAPTVENIDEYLGVYAAALGMPGYDQYKGVYNLDWKKAKLNDHTYWDHKLLLMTDLYSGKNQLTADTSKGEVDVEGTFGFKESHYLLNSMVNPVANVLFLDSFTSTAAPTWELRGIVVNTHWNNPDQDENTLLYQKYRKCVLYPHMLQHGYTDHFIGVVFHIAEVFDNKDVDIPPGRGTRVVPSFNYLSSLGYQLKRMVGMV